MKFIVSIICLQAFVFSQAQVDSVKNNYLDSLRTQFVKDSSHTYRPKKFRLLIGTDRRNSFIRNAPVNVTGLQIGFSYKGKHTMGFGRYNITQNSSKDVRKKDINNHPVVQNLSLNYITFYYQYTLIDKRFFELDLPFEIGLGRAKVVVFDEQVNRIVLNKTAGIIPLGAGIELILKPIKWIGISFMGGYRYVEDKDKRLNFNGSYYSIGVWIDLRQIVRDIKFYGFQRRKYRNKVAAFQH